MNYNNAQAEDIVKLALREDLGEGDITTETVIPKGKAINGLFLVKEDLVVCGLAIACKVFKSKDKNIKFSFLVPDGAFVKKGKVIAKISGKARSILAAERVSLNFLSFLSGIATKTRAYALKVRPYNVKIMDTRKTIPGLRILEKYAVRIGGGYNHRLSLDEMVMVKDNHLAAVKGIKGLKNLKIAAKKYKVEIEVENLKDFKQALDLNPDIIMLDNMSIKDIKKAVQIRNSLSSEISPLRPLLEVSGGITLNTIKKIASTGIDMISVGALTHSVDSVDISLEIP